MRLDTAGLVDSESKICGDAYVLVALDKASVVSVSTRSIRLQWSAFLPATTIFRSVLALVCTLWICILCARITLIG